VATGHYKAALLTVEFLWIVPIALENTLVHSTSKHWSRDDHEKIQRIATTLTRYTCILTSGLAILAVVLVDSFVPLYFGGTYDSTVLLAIILLPGAFSFAIARPIFGMVQGKGDIRSLILATAVAATLNLGLNMILIPRYGTNGAAVATSIGYGSMLFLHVWSARQSEINPIGDLRLPRVATSIIAAIVIAVPLDAMITSHVVSLPVVGTVGALTFGVAAVVTGAVDYQEISVIVRSVPGIGRHLEPE
jgi:O-antigen/teichoic acid export membrane protein